MLYNSGVCERNNSPINCRATAGGITKMPTNQSATAKDITKQLVTVLNRRVVKIAIITNVLPTTVTTITMHSKPAKLISCHPGGFPEHSMDGVAFKFESVVNGRSDILQEGYLLSCHI